MPYKDKQKYKEWCQKNKEKLNKKSREYSKEYRKTDKGKKLAIIRKWKHRGVISNDYDSLYNYYLSINNCEECNIELTRDNVRTKTTKCLDHDHDTGLFRNILCHTCNVKRQ
tara:strand:- start:167 stop:502 length:336 start_codon:yes stop_codon:yes gene_type:complete